MMSFTNTDLAGVFEKETTAIEYGKSSPLTRFFIDPYDKLKNNFITRGILLRVNCGFPLKIGIC